MTSTGDPTGGDPPGGTQAADTPAAHEEHDPDNSLSQASQPTDEEPTTPGQGSATPSRQASTRGGTFPSRRGVGAEPTDQSTVIAGGGKVGGSGKGPDYTGSDLTNYAACDMVPASSSNATWGDSRIRLQRNEARVAAHVVGIHSRLAEYGRRMDDIERRLARLGDLLAGHVQLVRSTMHYAQQPVTSTTLLSSRVDSVEQGVETLRERVTRISDTLDDQRERLASTSRLDRRVDSHRALRQLVERMREASRHTSTIGASVGSAPPGFFADDDDNSAGRAAPGMPSRVEQNRGSLLPGANANTPPATAPSSSARSAPVTGSKRAADSEPAGPTPKKRPNPLQTPGAGPSNASNAPRGGSAAPATSPAGRGGRVSNRPGRQADVRRPPAVSPNDVIIHFPGATLGHTRAAGYVLSLVGLGFANSAMASARHVGDDRRIVNVRFRTPNAATTVVNAVAAVWASNGLQKQVHEPNFPHRNAPFGRVNYDIAASPGGYTSHQPMTLAEDMDEEAAVDYAIAADSAVHRVHRLEVIRVDGRSDHSLLCLAVSIRVNASAHLHRTRLLYVAVDITTPDHAFIAAHAEGGTVDNGPPAPLCAPEVYVPLGRVRAVPRIPLGIGLHTVLATHSVLEYHATRVGVTKRGSRDALIVCYHLLRLSSEIKVVKPSEGHLISDIYAEDVTQRGPGKSRCE
ncbi:hypothetical protein EV121DRAFT_273474, partial [Schizophyllum commune]